MNEPAKIMRFYSDESTFLFESGTTEEAVSKNVLHYSIT